MTRKERKEEKQKKLRKSLIKLYGSDWITRILKRSDRKVLNRCKGMRVAIFEYPIFRGAKLIF